MFIYYILLRSVWPTYGFFFFFYLAIRQVPRRLPRLFCRISCSSADNIIYSWYTARAFVANRTDSKFITKKQKKKNPALVPRHPRVIVQRFKRYTKIVLNHTFINNSEYSLNKSIFVDCTFWKLYSWRIAKITFFQVQMYDKICKIHGISRTTTTTCTVRALFA